MTLVREARAPARRPPSDRALVLAVRIAVVTLVLGIAGFATYYYLDQRVETGPTLTQRQVTVAEQQVRATPNNLEARLALAQAYQSDHRPDDALAQYDEILRVDGGHRMALLGRGGVLLSKGDLAGAAASYQKITKAGGSGEFARADPQLEEAHYFLAQIASRQGQTQTTVTEAMAALRIEPTDSDAWFLLGQARLAVGQAQQAVAALRQAVLFVPDGWCDPYTQLVQAYGKLGDPAEAEYAGAMLDRCQQRPDQAVARLQKLVAGPAAVDAMLGLGTIAEGANHTDQALGWYRKVLAADPKNDAATKGVARLGAGSPSPSASRSTSPSASHRAPASNPASSPARKG
jgi:tetratricopeptide (TPR) repeat protein